ncbi:MAG: hypothetical protein E7455_04585 [Ruminococcaceae bacterium]|nr:hypothetical protein [Oscillospiraceae bacterium]
MPEDLEEIIPQLRRNDARCQKLLGKSYALSEQYFQILESLAPADRDCLEEYLSLCEELEGRTVQLVSIHYAINGTKVLKNTAM